MKKYAVILPGQGSQFVGMGKDLYERYDSAKKLYDEANEILGFDIKNLCFNGKLEELTQTQNAQPAILLYGMAVYEILKQEYGILPKYIAGHSLGEITALGCAGALSFEAVLMLARKRGEYMADAFPLGKGGMAAIVGAKEETIQEVCAAFNKDEFNVGIANYNTYEQIVISGYKEKVIEASEILKTKGAKVTQLNVSGPFHTTLMQQASKQLRDELEKYQFNTFKSTVISNVTATPYMNDALKIKENLCNQIVSPVKWYQTIEYLRKHGVNYVVDLGPKTVVKKLVERSNIPMQTFSYLQDKEALMERKAQEYQHTVISKCMAVAVCTKNFNDDEADYEEGVVKSYNVIKSIQQSVVEEGRKPNKEECITSLRMLKKIFDTKKTPIEEQERRFDEILEETNSSSEFNKDEYWNETYKAYGEENYGKEA